MEDKNKPLENFFNKSMEGFNESPSVSVWDELDQRLDSEMHWYDPYLNFFKLLIPILLVCGMGMYFFYNAAQTKWAQKENLFLSQISELEQENINITTTNKALKNEITAISTPPQRQDAKTKLATLLKQDVNTQSLLNEIAILKQRIAQHALDLAEKQNYIASLITTNDALQSKLNFINNNKDVVELGVNEPKTTTINSEDSNVETLGDSGAVQHLDLSKFMTGSSSEIIKDFSSPTYTFVQNEPKEKEGIYRFGPSARYFNTFVEFGYHANPGFSWGMRQELRLSRRFSITNNLHYNQQRYIINNSDQVLPRDVVDRYPGRVDDELQVQSIESKNAYFDAHLGLKYVFNPNAKNTRWFLNPGVVWQLYLPQEFQYNLIQASDLLVDRNVYYGYFGSGNIALGFDRKITKKLRWQCSGFLEGSFIPLGVDEQYVKMIGVSNSILFGS